MFYSNRNSCTREHWYNCHHTLIGFLRMCDSPQATQFTSGRTGPFLVVHGVWTWCMCGITLHVNRLILVFAATSKELSCFPSFRKEEHGGQRS